MANAELQMLAKIGRQAWKLSWWLLGIQAVATVVAVAALKVIPKKYESSTTIRVERSQLINPLVRGLAVSSESEERIRSIREEILSKDYFDKIITRLALEPPNTPPLAHEARVLRMIEDTKIATRQRDAGTFQITYSGDDPKEVRDVTNLLAGIFIEDSLSNKAGEAGSAVEFLQGQLEIYRKKLEEAEAALRKFTEKYIDQLPSNRAAQLARVEQLRSTLIEVQNSLRQSTIQRDLLRQQVLPAGSQPPGDAVTAGIPTQASPGQMLLRQKEADLRRLLVDYSESYPDVVALRAEIDALRQDLEKFPAAPVAQTPAPASASRQASVQDALSLGQLQQLEVLVASLVTREGQLTQELARYEKKVQGIPEVEQELARLKRDYDVNNDIYNNFLRRLEEAKVSKELEASKKGEVFRILQAAALPLSPARPKRVPTIILGVAAGLGLNALLVFVLAQLDTSIQSVEEAQKLLGLKVLAGVPRHPPQGEQASRNRRNALLAAACAAYAACLGVILLWDTVVSLLGKG